MPTVNVKVTIQGLQFDPTNFETQETKIALPDSSVFFKKNLGDDGPAKGVTDRNGVCNCEVETGVWICTAKVPGDFIDPLIGSVEVFANRPVHLIAELIDAKDCENIILTLRRLIDKAGKTEKRIKTDLSEAKRLIRRIEGTYNNYKELPVLFQMADLEKELPGYVPEKNDGFETLKKRPPSSWKNIVKD